jgi:hypothetical protein
MKRVEQIVNRHNKNMLTHFKLYLKKRTSLHSKKIFNETVRDIESYIEQELDIRLNHKPIIQDDGQDQDDEGSV